MNQQAPRVYIRKKQNVSWMIVMKQILILDLPAEEGQVEKWASLLAIKTH